MDQPRFAESLCHARIFSAIKQQQPARLWNLFRGESGTRPSAHLLYTSCALGAVLFSSRCRPVAETLAAAAAVVTPAVGALGSSSTSAMLEVVMARAEVTTSRMSCAQQGCVR